MQDLKTGHLLRASPRSQFYGQIIGSLASVFVSAAGYKFYTSVYEIPGPQFAVPSAGVWYAENPRLPEHVADSQAQLGPLAEYWHTAVSCGTIHGGIRCFLRLDLRS